MNKIKKIKNLSEIQREEYKNATICHIYEEELSNLPSYISGKDSVRNDAKDKVQDHDHLTGLYTGAAHQICNLNYKVVKCIPVFFHNFSGYDSHLLVKELGNDKENIDLIPINEDNYI